MKRVLKRWVGKSASCLPAIFLLAASCSNGMPECSGSEVGEKISSFADQLGITDVAINSMIDGQVTKQIAANDEIKALQARLADAKTKEHVARIQCAAITSDTFGNDSKQSYCYETWASTQNPDPGAHNPYEDFYYQNISPWMQVQRAVPDQIKAIEDKIRHDATDSIRQQLSAGSNFKIGDARSVDANRDAKYVVCRGKLTIGNDELGTYWQNVSYRVSRTADGAILLESAP